MKRISLTHNPFHLFNHPTRNRKPTAAETRIIHAHLIKTAPLQSHLILFNSLLNSYCNSGATADALNMLNEIPHSNDVTWNLMISGFNQRLQFDGSFGTFRRMHSIGFEPDHVTYGSILSACAASQVLHFGEQVYALVIKNGFFSDGYVCTGVIDLFAKSGRYGDALRVFSVAPHENVVCWNAIISGAVRNRENWIALDLFHQMLDWVSTPNSFTFSSILTACTALGELEIGRGIHGLVIKCGVGDDVFVGTAIVDLYAKCSHIDEAVKEFTQMPERNVVSWTAMISSFVQLEDSVNALKVFKEMKKISTDMNNYTVTSVLAACAKPSMAKVAIQMHCLILKTGFSMCSTVKDALINMYARAGEIHFSEVIFEEIDRVENVSTWAVMISGFARNEDSSRSIELFCRMFQEGLKPDNFCISSVLSVIRCLGLGKQIHSYVFKAGLAIVVSVGSSLFTMYSKCGNLDDAYNFFIQMPEKDGVSWTSMIAGFAEHGLAGQAFCLFREMLIEEIKPDRMTLSVILMACSNLQSLQKGKEIHGYAFRMGLGTETLFGGALMNMYFKCKALVSARQFFNAMPERDESSWSSLVSGYAQNGYSEEALMQFHQMLIDGIDINCFTISSIIGVSATLTRATLGRQLHACSVKKGFDSDLLVSSSLVTMYSKCGSIDDSRKIFDQIDRPDLVTWTAMIDGYAQHGYGMEALKIYEMMREKGIEPDSVTFTGILSACSHSGLVEEGYSHLNSMTKDYGIEPKAHHYACIVDLLSRSGRLEEAERFISSMPIKPDSLIWGTLLGACRVHGNLELGKLATEKVLELEPCDSGAYVSLSNIFADMGNWEEVMKIRNLMKGVDIKKEPGWSAV